MDLIYFTKTVWFEDISCRGVGSGGAGGVAPPPKLFERGPEYLSAPPKNIYAIILQNIL